MEELRRQFQCPPVGYGPIPFWFWNADLTAEELCRQVREMKEKGMSGAFMHARHGQLVPYLSEEWMRLTREVVHESAQCDFQAWLYDEDNWPSGSAGWRVAEGHPELESRYLKAIILQKPQGNTSVEVSNLKGTLISAIAYPIYVETEKLDPQTGINLTARLQEVWNAGNLVLDLPELNPENEWKIFIFCSVPNGYADTMNPASTRRFIDLTHEAYAKEVGDYFGTTIPGIFTDECTLVNVWNESDPQILPWSSLLPDEFKKRHGYQLGNNLPALFADLGIETTKIRQDYWQTVSDLYVTGYARQISQWCDKHHLVFTGHVLYEELLMRQVRVQANTMAFYREMQIPGIDNLRFSQEGFQHKLAASVAHQMGKERILSETFGAAEWGTPLSKLKPSLDWQLIQGVNLFCPHAAYYSIYGKRKREYPPSEFIQAPYWPYYKHFADYMARLSYMLSRGKHIAKVAVLFPIRSAWAHYDPTEKDPLMGILDKDFNYICELLQRLHYDFDFISEESLQEASVQDGKLQVGECEYELLVIPSVTTIQRKTWLKIIDYFENCGKVIALGFLAKESELGEDDVLAAASAREGLMDLEAVYDGYLLTDSLEGSGAPTFPATRNHLKGGRFCSFQPHLMMNQTDGKNRVRQLMREMMFPEVETLAEEIRYHHRKLDEGDLFFFANITDKFIRANLKVDVLGTPEIWDAETGETHPMPQYGVMEEDQSLVLSLEFSPNQSYLIFISGEVKPHVDSANFKVTDFNFENEIPIISGWSKKAGKCAAVVDTGADHFNMIGSTEDSAEEIRLNGPWHFRRESPNILVLPDWYFCRGDFGPSSSQKPEWELLPERLPIHGPDNREPLEMERPPFVTYQTEFIVKKIPEKLSLVLEPIGAVYKVFINGTEVNPVRTGILDPDFLETSIIDCVKEGNNEILIVADYRGIPEPERPNSLHRITCDLVPEPARLAGDFALESTEYGTFALVAEPNTLETGSWTDQGYPHYSGTLEYFIEAEIPERFLSQHLVMTFAKPADLVELKINGNSVGSKLWGLFEFNLTGYLHDGKNEVSIRIANTAINAILGRPQDSGLLDTPIIHAYPMVKLTERTEVDWSIFNPQEGGEYFDLDL